MPAFEPPPTYAEVILVNDRVPQGTPGHFTFNPIWLKWFVDITQFISTTTSQVATGTGPTVHQTGPTLTNPSISGGSLAGGTVSGTTVKATTVGGYKSSDGSAGSTGAYTFGTAHTLTVKDGIITGYV